MELATQKDSGLSDVLRENVTTWGLRIGSIVVFLIVWQLYGSRPDTFAVAPPSKVFPVLWEIIVTGEILKAALGTLYTMLVGYSVAVIIGVSVGFAIALSVWARNTIEPIINALYATPMGMLIPILGVYIGLGFRGRVVLVIIWSVFVIIINTSTGVREVSPSLIEMAQSFSLSRWSIYRKVILPAALPGILIGLRLGVGRALRGAVTAELLLIVVNLGRFLIGAGSTFDMPRLLGGILFVTIMGLVLLQSVQFLEGRILAWRHYN